MGFYPTIARKLVRLCEIRLADEPASNGDCPQHHLGSQAEPLAAAPG